MEGQGEKKEGTMHPLLEKERRAAAFDVQTLMYVLDGGEEFTNFKNIVMKELDTFIANGKYGDDDEDEEKSASDVTARPSADHTLSQAREQTMLAIREHYMQFFQDTGISALKRQARVELLNLYDPGYFTRNGVHFGLFLSAVQGQGEEDQISQWVQDGLLFRLAGCFAMTELGHGSFVRGLETTATYDVEKEEFVINTPSITATKWWIGGAAHTATHAAVFAQLILPRKQHDGEHGTINLGVHTFVVPLRCMETHAVLPGITIGDCGAKFGRHGIDNGYIQFHNVRVPRNNLLRKYTRVEADGSYSLQGKKQLQYGALIGGRASMINDSALWLKAALTITIRYLTVRRQGEPFDGEVAEPQIIDYLTVQSRLMPLLADVFGLTFTALYMKRMTGSGDVQKGELDIEGLPDLHATCAGLKAFCTWAAYEGLDTCRQCIGGHGYSAYTGLGRMFADFAVQCTWEGDNTVMALQTARYLVSSYEKLQKKEKLNGSVEYLESLPRINRQKRTWNVRGRKKLSVDSLLDAFRYLLARKVERVAGLVLKESKKQGYRRAFNNHSAELLDSSRAHCYYVMANTFSKEIKMLRNSSIEKERSLFPILEKLCLLFCVHHISRWLDWFQAIGYMNGQQVFMIKDEEIRLYGVIRSQCIPLVDSFNLSDGVLRSPLGCYDGNFYHKYFDRVKASGTSPQEVAPYYQSAIRPLLQAFM
mmetsp:Transcript_3645/g.9965  ORF Transcript_3645/g.9965 Transcript_3645/m.9965 type:complete len:707 (+) Transcript_3645:88-2208(+)